MRLPAPRGHSQRSVPKTWLLADEQTHGPTFLSRADRVARSHAQASALEGGASPRLDQAPIPKGSRTKMYASKVKRTRHNERIAGMKRRRTSSALACVALGLALTVGCAGEGDLPRNSRQEPPRLADDSVAAVELEAAQNCRGPLSDMRSAGNAVPGEIGAFVGEVTSVNYARSSTGSPVFINLDSDYPDPQLSVAIFSNAAPSLARWARDQVRAGDTVCASGEVQDFDGIDQLIVTSSAAIEVVEEGPNTRAVYLSKPCAQVFLNFESWSNPPTALQIQNAALKPDYPTSNDFELGEAGYKMTKALMAYQEEAEDVSYALFDPNLPALAAYDLRIQLLDRLEDVARACGELSSIGGEIPRDLLTRQR